MELLSGTNLLYLILGLITFALGCYFGFLCFKLKLVKEESQKAKKERVDYLLESIRVIALATVQKQCDLSESCVRLHYLMHQEEVKDFFEIPNVLNLMHSELSKFAMLDARKKLSKQERFDQDKLRFKVEDKYIDEYLEFIQTTLENPAIKPGSILN